MAALFTLFQGGGTFPSSRHVRNVECNTTFPENECEVTTVVSQLGATSSFPFNVNIDLKKSVNDKKAFLSVNSLISSFDTIQDLEEEEDLTDDATCGYLLKPPAARDLLHPYCSWYYNCSYDARRVPQHLCRAQCSETCLHCPQGYSCKPVLYKVPVLRLNSDFNNQCHPYLQIVADPSVQQWTWSQESVSVSCACQKTAASDCQGV